MSDNKDDKNKSLTVRDSSFGIMEAGLANLSPEKKQKILNKAAEEALNLEVESRKKRQESGQAMQDMDAVFTRFEDVPNSKGSFTKIEHELKTGSGRVKIVTRKGFGCFVATIAFDSPEAEEVHCLREFRDNVLCNVNLGRGFISWYYEYGPSLATMVGRHQSVKWLIRKMLSLLICIWKAIR
jgi:hypothetical protein